MHRDMIGCIQMSTGAPFSSCFFFLEIPEESIVDVVCPVRSKPRVLLRLRGCPGTIKLWTRAAVVHRNRHMADLVRPA